MSDRVLYVDVLLVDRKYRAVAVYIPHVGYTFEEYDICFDHLRQTIIDAQRHGIKCMVGGDFNIELYRGWRGNRLREFVHEGNFEVANDPIVLPNPDAWSFQSALGVRRVLDYCLFLAEINVPVAACIDRLFLGSRSRSTWEDDSPGNVAGEDPEQWKSLEASSNNKFKTYTY